MNENKQFTLLELSDVSFRITDTLPISNKSVFGDTIWDFNDNENVRLNSVDKSKLMFDWDEWELKTNNSIKNDMKIVAFFYLKCASIVSKRAITNSGFKPNTLYPIFKTTLIVLEQIMEKESITIVDGKICLIEDLSDLTIEHFQSIPLIKKNQSYLKKMLKTITNPIIREKLSCEINWNLSDVENLNIPPKPDAGLQELSSQPLKDEFFCDLLRQATIDVINFKKLMKLKVHAKVPESYVEEINENFEGIDFLSAFNDYVDIRETQIARLKENILKSKKYDFSHKERKKFVKNYKINPGDIFKKLVRIQRASIYILIQLTGVRYSESISFKYGSIKEKSENIYIIKGTIIKNEPSNLPSDIDEWIAIPIVRDAVELLELLQKFTFNSYLISSMNSVYSKEENLPYSLNGLTAALNAYVSELGKSIVKFNEYANNKDNHITVHRLRHTLALQMVRAKLGIPYISYHLKHVHTGLVAYQGVSNVTLGYGGIAAEIFNSVPAIKKARKEFYNQIYNPDSPIGGGVNSIEYKKRRKEYFQGRLVTEDEIDEIIDELMEQSIPFVDVGLGYCGGRKDVTLKDGTKKPPPCIGLLQCNPLECGNAIITESKLPIWEKMYRENSAKLNDPEFNYAKEHLQRVVNQSIEIINHFKTERD